MSEFYTHIEKTVLLEVLQKNRERYVGTRKILVDIYKQKVKEYKVKYTEYIDKEVEGTLSKEDKKPYPPILPEDRTETYDMYISMVENHIIDTIKITDKMYKKLYYDDWAFIREHIAALSVFTDSFDSAASAIEEYSGVTE